MLPPEVRRGSNDDRSGAKSYHEFIDMEEHGHVLISNTVPERKTRKQMLHEEKRLLRDFLNALDGHVTIYERLIPCVEGAKYGNL